jgi:transposase
MSMGRWQVDHQAEFWVPTAELPQSPGHVFYDKLNALLAEAQFDAYVEDLCREYYADGAGRDSIPPGVYFRMLLVGYFEGSTPSAASPGAAPTACPCGPSSACR